MAVRYPKSTFRNAQGMELSRDGHQIGSVDQWFEFARPRGGRHHWRDGYSAKELAKAWCAVDGRPEAPVELAALLRTIPEFPGLVVARGHPEYRVNFDGLPGEPRNADLVLHCETLAGRVGVSIEAKSREDFGPPVNEVVAEAARKWCDEAHSNYMPRLQNLYRTLFLRRKPGAPRWGELRYQLLTAAAGALVYAAQIDAAAAALIVHEFRPSNINEVRYADNSRDFRNFVQRIGDVLDAEAGVVYGPFSLPGGGVIPEHMPFYIGKLVSPCDPVQPLGAQHGHIQGGLV
jgi:hypothetical protein